MHKFGKLQNQVPETSNGKIKMTLLGISWKILIIRKFLPSYFHDKNSEIN